MLALSKRSPFAIHSQPSLSMHTPGATYFDGQNYISPTVYVSRSCHRYSFRCANALVQQPHGPAQGPITTSMDFNTPSAYDPPEHPPELPSGLMLPPTGSTNMFPEPPIASTSTENQSTSETQTDLDVEGFLDWLHSSEAAEMATGLGLLPPLFSQSTQNYAPNPTSPKLTTAFSGTVPALTVTGPPAASLLSNDNNFEQQTARGGTETLRRTVSPQSLLKPPELTSSIVKTPENNINSYPSPPTSNSRSRAASVSHSSTTATPSPEPVVGISISRFSRASNPSIPRRHSVQEPVPPPMQRKDPHKNTFIPSALGYDSNPPPPRIVKIAPDSAAVSSHQPKSRTPSVLKPGRIPEERLAMPSVLAAVEANEAVIRRSIARPILSGRSYTTAYAVPHNSQPSRKRRHSSLGGYEILPNYSGKKVRLEKPDSRGGGTLPVYPAQFLVPASASNFIPQNVGRDSPLSLSGQKYLSDNQQPQQSLPADLPPSNTTGSDAPWDPQTYGAWDAYIQTGSFLPEVCSRLLSIKCALIDALSTISSQAIQGALVLHI